MKYLGINLAKEEQHKHTENYRTSLKQVGEDLNKWKDAFVDGKTQCVKTAILLNSPTDRRQSLSKY